MSETAHGTGAPHVVIVGSGLGGLACGSILARNGYAVTLLEQHHRIGGCLQCFRRNGAKFETGMHFIGSAAPGQTLHRLLRYLEVAGSVQLDELSPDGYDVVSMGGREYRFAKGRERFISQMAEYFPHQRENLERYYSLIEEIAGASPLHSLRLADADRMVSPEYQLRSIGDVLDEIITDRKLADVLCGTLPLYAGRRDATPFSMHAFIMDFYNQSAYRVAGGSDGIANALAESIRRRGGKIITGAKVIKVNFADGKAVAARLADGREIPCDIIISDAHPQITMNWLDTSLIRAATRRRVNAIPQTPGGFSLYLKFREDSVPYLNYNYYRFLGDSPWGCETYTEDTWPCGYLYMHMCHAPHPRFAHSAVVLSYMNFDDVRPWADTTVGCRGEEYLEFKRLKAEKLLDQLYRDFPSLHGCIESYSTSTPLTYRDYTGTVEGGMYGVARDVNTGSASRITARTRVPNLFQTGQNINSHGILGVLVGAIVTCSELIPAKTIYQQLLQTDE